MEELFQKYQQGCLPIRFVNFKNILNQASLWIDVEGATKNVLHGFSDSFRRGTILSVLIEVESKPQWQDQWKDLDVVSFFISNNFIPILRDNEYKNQFNIIFIREDLFDGEVLAIMNYFYSSISKFIDK